MNWDSMYLLTVAIVVVYKWLVSIYHYYTFTIRLKFICFLWWSLNNNICGRWDARRQV